MQAFFTAAYNDQLDTSIQALELESSVELVTVIYPESDHYRDSELCGFILLTAIWLLVTFMIHLEIHLYLILFGTLLCFSLGIGLVKGLNPLKRLLTNKARMRREAEIMARAVFQKAHLHRTSHHTAVLVFVSVMEQRAIVLWDIGVDMALNIEDLDQLAVDFDQIFEADAPPQALLEQIKACTPLFAQHLPVQPNDINELPNHLSVQL
mgnify:CR=1 FL=1